MSNNKSERMYEGYEDLTYKNIYERRTIINFAGIRKRSRNLISLNLILNLYPAKKIACDVTRFLSFRFTFLKYFFLFCQI